MPSARRPTHLGRGTSDTRLQATEEKKQGSEATKQELGMEYYAGLLKTDVRIDNGSSANDMLFRNMQLAGGVTGLLGLLLLGFMASNGLL
ncbi:hypothetical protein CHLRE_03g144384v5 [Chlamydomonas reinhardtii]|uniref:Uncharacterized protein n=1 Tax=Chlamydomonas reinhardtii TaxID=3055 RepID=A0A2K3DV72_CHLRE|nr:uncharacterized protein CHLRE_03g144384v5 [Chlamydomonas reinhardtii]PNW84412.1 hypothetical protein CHLRE_03g144384v5 [Chlamydomonas reinhardtii]